MLAEIPVRGSEAIHKIILVVFLFVVEPGSLVISIFYNPSVKRTASPLILGLLPVKRFCFRPGRLLRGYLGFAPLPGDGTFGRQSDTSAGAIAWKYCQNRLVYYIMSA